jgi:hypothetical protein
MPMLDSTNRGFDFEWSHVFLACVFVVQALNNWGLALQVDLLNCLNCLVWRFSTVDEVIYRFLGYATLHHS